MAVRNVIFVVDRYVVPPVTNYNVMDYGAVGDGVADDYAAIMATIAAAGTTSVYFPAGTYYSGTVIEVPTGTTFDGAGRTASWLKGRINFNSNFTCTGLKLGNSGNSALRNLNNANNVLFQHCRITGGGGASSSTKPVIALGYSYPCSNISFIDCEIDRNVGVEDAELSKGYNNITIRAAATYHETITDIVFDGCHIGTSNGVSTGSPRMGLECYSDAGALGGWHRITVKDTIVEVCDSHGLNFSDVPGAGRANGVLVDGCTLKGGGLAQINWGDTLCIEYPLAAIIRNNTIYKGWEGAIVMTDRSNIAYTGPATQFYNNTINLDYDNGITTFGWYQIKLEGDSNSFTNNTIYGGEWSSVIALYPCTNSVVNYNTFYNLDPGQGLIYQYAGSYGNIITPNTTI